MENNRLLSASCVVIHEGCVLLVKHTYGAVKGKYLIPGGFSELLEMPQRTAEREVLEETNVTVNAEKLVAVRFTEKEVWCIFSAAYVSGTPASDGCENDEAIFMPVEEALASELVVETTKVIIRAVQRADKSGLAKSTFVNGRFTKDNWQLFI
ncbi:MAG: NUDIX domain-containing protein [Clostridia bacterium]|nr:NUDIX domain-containing protein [Clostridia bacterium]